jgi:hypothetical protein
MSQRLAELDEQRELMLGGISHDLRTPLARLRVAVELLDKDDAALTREIAANIEEMDRMIGQFLHYARAGYRETPARASLDEIVRQTLAIYASDERLRLEPGAAEPRLFAIDSVRHMLLNLVQNALEYGRPPVTVRSSSMRHGDSHRGAGPRRRTLAGAVGGGHTAVPPLAGSARRRACGTRARHGREAGARVRGHVQRVTLACFHLNGVRVRVSGHGARSVIKTHRVFDLPRSAVRVDPLCHVLELPASGIRDRDCVVLERRRPVPLGFIHIQFPRADHGTRHIPRERSARHPQQ